MIENHAIANAEPGATRSDSDDLSAWLVPGDHVTIRFVAATQMFAINGSDVTTADTRGFHLDKDLTVTRFRNWLRAKFDFAISG
jgi:hypothetical protein